MNKIYFYRLFFLSAILLFSCCKKDQDKDGVVDDKDECPEVFAKTKDGCPVAARELNKVNLYIETSASMAGYFNQDAEYKTIISDLSAKINKNIKPLTIWFIADSTTKYTKNVEQFSSDIATTKIADQKSSQLHKIIHKIASNTDSSDITLLVSDCILSFPDAAIKDNPEINKTEAPNALKNNIFNTFSELKKRGLATSVYAFKSKFYGTYYDYQNVKTKINGNNRPFYIWVIGNKELLGKFNVELADISTFKPEKSLHFGLAEEPVTKYDILTQIEKNGQWSRSNTGLEDIEIPKNDSLRFCLGLQLKNLPLYAQEPKYLQNNLKIEENGCKSNFRVKAKDAVDKSKLKTQKQINLFVSDSHLIVFSVSEMPLQEATIKVSLPLQYDTWYLDWSTSDDGDITATGNKTFALEHLINGVKEAYETKNKNYIDFLITLKK